MVQREGWASSEPVWYLLHRGPRVGPGLPVLEGRLDIETGSVQGRPLASEALLSVALSSYAGASLSSSLNSIY